MPVRCKLIQKCFVEEPEYLITGYDKTLTAVWPYQITGLVFIPLGLDIYIWVSQVPFIPGEEKLSLFITWFIFTLSYMTDAGQKDCTLFCIFLSTGYERRSQNYLSCVYIRFVRFCPCPSAIHYF